MAADGSASVRLDAGQREVPEREPQVPAELVSGLLDRAGRLPGVRALVVAVLEDQVAGGRAADMVDVLLQRRQCQLPVARRGVDSPWAICWWLRADRAGPAGQ